MGDNMKLPKGMEPMIFSYAYYKVNDFEKIIAFFKELEEKNLLVIDKCYSKKQTFIGAFVRPYPKGHWNPLSNMPGAVQILCGVEIKNQILKIDTKTKSGLEGFRKILEESLKGIIEFERQEFEDVMEMLRKEKKN